jgi:D-threo-aldose 1-dehydrogenase
MIELCSYREIGSNRLAVPALGLGLAPLGNLYSPVSDSDSQATLAAAMRHGIALFDVAPYYGFGLAEARLGSFLKRSSVAQLVVVTKVGRVLEPAGTVPSHEHFVSPLPYQPRFDYSRMGIERSYTESLRRLGLDRVQILLLHDVDRLTHPVGHRAFMRQLLDESLPTLHRLKCEGRVDAIGLGINEWDVGYEILASADIDCVLLAGRYTLLDQSAFSSGFLDACARRSVGVLAGGVFNSGFLAGGSRYDYCPASEELVSRRYELVMLCKRYEIPLAALALQFTAAHPAIISMVVGARSAEEVDAIENWRRIPIPPELWHSLRAQRLIPMDVPTPDFSLQKNITCD